MGVKKTAGSRDQFGEILPRPCHSEPVVSAKNLLSASETADSSGKATRRNDNTSE